MKKFVLVLFSCLMIHGLRAQTFNAQLATMLQDTLNTYVTAFTNIKGMSASAYIPGQGIWTGTSGVSYAGHPITTDMRLGVGSNTKLFVSTIMLMLAEDNILSLDDSLKRWLPTYPNINPNIKIRQLLNHSSGISDPFFVSPWMDTLIANPNRIFTPTEVLGWVGAPLFSVGTSFSYSNPNYILAGMIAKVATGLSMSKLIRDSILTPLNMDSTFYDVEEPQIGTVAHRWWNAIDYNSTSLTGFNSALGCAGSLYSQSAEMVQWYNALFNGQIINQASLNQISTFISTGSPNQGYGLGLFRNVTAGLPYWSHGGDAWGFKSQMIYDSCLHVSVCGLSNSYPSASAVQFLLYRVIKNHIPGCSSPIVGLSNVCEGTNAVVYSVPPIPNATSYSWTLPSGVTGVSSTNSITVNYGMGALSGDIIVRGVNNYGPGGFSTLAVTVKRKPVVGFTTNNPMQVLTGNSFTFTDTTSGLLNTRLWSFGDNTTNTIVSPVKVYSAINVYAVKLRVTTSANCADSFTRIITVLPNAPSNGSSNLVLNSTSNTSISLSWTNGNGQSRVVIAKANSAVNASPQNGMSYTANPIFGSGAQLGTGNYVVYKGVSNNVIVTGLAVASRYYFAVIELNGDTTLSSYQTPTYLTGNQITLPVKWQSISASCTPLNTAMIKWVTASEINSDYFEVQRINEHEFNTANWQVIGKVKGSGNSRQLTQYEFIDNELGHSLAESSSLVYRLRQVDFDGVSDYSTLVKLHCAEQTSVPTLSLYPNPNSGIFNLSFDGMVGLKTIIISDVMGKIIQKVQVSENSSDINLINQGKGIYLLRVETANGFYYSKVVVN